MSQREVARRLKLTRNQVAKAEKSGLAKLQRLLDMGDIGAAEVAALINGDHNPHEDILRRALRDRRNDSPEGSRES